MEDEEQRLLHGDDVAAQISSRRPTYPNRTFAIRLRVQMFVAAVLVSLLAPISDPREETTAH